MVVLGKEPIGNLILRVLSRKRYFLRTSIKKDTSMRGTNSAEEIIAQ